MVLLHLILVYQRTIQYEDYEARFAAIDNLSDVKEQGFDIIGEHVFPIILESVGEEEFTFLPAMEPKYSRLVIFIADTDGEIIEEMKKNGYTYYDWNASLEDAVLKSEPEQLIQNAKESTLGRKRIIMLAHDTMDNTALCLEELIEEFPEYKMECLDGAVEPIQF